jgi:PTS system fructose-specific IIC component
MFFLAILIGTVVTAAMIGFLKKDLPENQR